MINVNINYLFIYNRNRIKKMSIQKINDIDSYGYNKRF